MPNLKTIKNKISSVKNTRQITKAMKMVSAAKFKKKLSAFNAFKPYAEMYAGTINEISKNTVLYRHPFFSKREDAGTVGIIIVSTDRGLCGSFNVNLFKLFSEELKIRGLNEKAVHLYIFGKKAVDYFKRHNFTLNYGIQFSDAEAKIKNIEGEDFYDEIGGIISEDFKTGKIGSLFIISNSYISTLSQKAVIEKILPFDSSDGIKNSGGYLIDSSVENEDEILDNIFTGFIKTKIRFAAFESFAGEQASRMNAMENATRNAGHLINKLTVSYNKARQAAVTLEILDIINGVNSLR